MTQFSPVGAVSEAIKGAFTHFGEMVRLVWLAGLLYIGLSALGGFFEIQGRPMMAMLMNLGTLLVSPMIAVAWHRFIILGERGERTYFQFGRREVKFLAATFLLVLPIAPAIVLTVSTGMLGMEGSPNPVLGLLAVAAIGIGAYYVIRLSLLLPAVAIDQRFDIGAVLQITRGHFWRLFAAFLLLGIVMFIAIALTGLVLYILPLAGVVLLPLVMILMQIIGVAILSIAYRDLSAAPAGEQLPA